MYILSFYCYNPRIRIGIASYAVAASPDRSGAAHGASILSHYCHLFIPSSIDPLSVSSSLRPRIPPHLPRKNAKDTKANAGTGIAPILFFALFAFFRGRVNRIPPPRFAIFRAMTKQTPLLALEHSPIPPPSPIGRPSTRREPSPSPRAIPKRRRSRSVDPLPQIAGLSAEQRTALSCLVGGETHTRAAQLARVSRATLYNWEKKDPDYIAALNAVRDHLITAPATA